eukprot:scaffold268456_cov43-Tisochrysis_lutea.AAC.2
MAVFHSSARNPACCGKPRSSAPKYACRNGPFHKQPSELNAAARLTSYCSIKVHGSLLPHRRARA